MDKPKIGRTVYKSAKYFMIFLWIIVTILLVKLIIVNKTLSIDNINKTTIEVFQEGYFSSAIEMGNRRVFVSVTIPENSNVLAVGKARDYIYKLSKFKNKDYDTLALMIGFNTTVNQKNIILTAETDLKKIKTINWDNIKSYEDAIRELNIKF